MKMPRGTNVSSYALAALSTKPVCEKHGAARQRPDGGEGSHVDRRCS